MREIQGDGSVLLTVNYYVERFMESELEKKNSQVTVDCIL